MRLTLPYAAALTCALAMPAAAQEENRARIFASAPSHHAVTVYRDPEREEEERMRRNWPQGFAMISETRTVTLPPGQSTILFEGVAEGMVAVSAIVTGLPGGTIEKNRNADLLSPAALVDRTLGNRVTITRTNPGTGEASSEEAIVRTRADGGLVLETQSGFEAVRCSGLPEKLTFDSVPRELSANPIFNIDTFSETGGTYEVTLTYLSWGFDWEANYVAYLGNGKADGTFDMQLMSWLTVLNDNGQSFPDAELMVVAGELVVESDFEDLADAPTARPLRLNCYPLGSTATGSPVPFYGPYPPPPPPPPSPAMMDSVAPIVVTGSRARQQALELASPVTVLSAEAMAREEALGDLKLYRVPRGVTVAAKGMKQVAFLSREAVSTRWVYEAQCDPLDDIEDFENLDPTSIKLVTENTEESGLGASLPMGNLTVYENTSVGPQLVSELNLRDYPYGQDVELEIGDSTQVFAECNHVEDKDAEDRGRRWTKMRVLLSNANDAPVRVRLKLGYPDEWEIRYPRRKPQLKDGEMVIEVEVPPNGTFDKVFRIRPTKARLR
ncbi:hypothetical protein K3152_03060 [Qipengyuania sp. 1NDH17]|uniref:DUF4139 domain-containing protein n=1 Tax=Qipengyuania polymorpha TaxID=2867234 RepID=A0ABS7IUW1_9SPHN|nr:hypothetical protein [Qipengyuania polymorpha]MBX7457217.1 hypothetical protein [Qipengyuania polymorpha]